MKIRVYVGDLGDQGSRAELERAFSRYGHVTEVWVARNPPGFAFVFFESYREAEDACRGLNGTNICGVRVRVEVAKGPEKGEKNQRGPNCRECGRAGHSARECTRRSGYVYRGRNSEYQRRHSNSRDRRSRSRSYSRERSYNRRRSPEEFARRGRSPANDYSRRGRKESYQEKRYSRSRSIERRRSPPSHHR